MGTLTFAGLFGFFLGMRHATDADHVVAVSTIVARTRRLGASLMIGAMWGLGHMLTIFAVGVAIIVFKVVIPERVGLSMEFTVGLMLILLGALNLSGLWARLSLQGLSHEHPHDHDGPHGHHLPGRIHGPHAHPHPHEAGLGRLDELASAAGFFQFVRAFAVGLVHGLAGSAAVALMVLATIPTAAGGLIYLAVFGLGTLAGMLILSAMMETSLYYLTARYPIQRWIVSGTGAFSVLFGLYMVYHIGFVDGLFVKY